MPVGKHVIKAKVDWCGSSEITFDIKENETKTFYLSGFKYGDLFSKIALGILALHFILSFTLHIEYAIYLIIPFALYNAYYITIGRNQYLILSEEFLT